MALGQCPCTESCYFAYATECTCKCEARARGASGVQGFEEVPLASALAAVAREPNSAALLDVRDEDAEG